MYQYDCCDIYLLNSRFHLSNYEINKFLQKLGDMFTVQLHLRQNK